MTDQAQDTSLTHTEGGFFFLQGNLDFDTVPQLLDDGDVLFEQHDTEITLDLGGVRRTTSVGLALLVEWYRRAHHSGISISFIKAPEQLMAMARFSQLDSILEISAE